ncbi:hypothetical protein BV898_05975 [Hypsibius exemplaris]|uniref:G-protein coupled receptors family 1 profile domain-containing protein n=1 Tax=Hypsibius exemplaris TaxID=2072580 RepID=A0A1W0WXN9_HYPEX|nr:hypothetical protein BV898_05975 [Hypsibius exemplaris]
MEAQLPTLSIGTAITSTQLFNLLIFTLWRNKEPYILLHIALAVASLLGGVSMIMSLPLRYVTHTPVHVFLNLLLVIVLVNYAKCAAILANVAISVDRWLSVEFPVRYRTDITRRKALWAGIVTAFGGALLLDVPGLILFWQNMNFGRCTGLRTFYGQGVLFTVWEAVKGPIFFPLLFLSQLRILMIAMRLKLQRHLQRRRVAKEVLPPGNASAPTVARIVWSSVWGSMAVVICTLIAHVPNYFLANIPNSASAAVRRFAVYLTLVQHCVSPVIYLLFWPLYRKAVMRLLGRVRAVMPLHTPGWCQPRKNRGSSLIGT